MNQHIFVVVDVVDVVVGGGDGGGVVVLVVSGERMSQVGSSGSHRRANVEAFPRSFFDRRPYYQVVKKQVLGGASEVAFG